VRLRLGITVSQLLHETMLGLGHLLAFPLALRPFDHRGEGHIEPPSLWAFALRQDVTQRVPSCLAGLGQPFPPLRPCQFRGDEGRLPQHAAAVLPEQCVSGVRGSIARRAAVAPGCPQRIGAPLTDIRVIARGERPPGTRQPTRPTADEATQEVLVRRMVTLIDAGALGLDGSVH
jgi:hypothetical protein